LSTAAAALEASTESDKSGAPVVTSFKAPLLDRILNGADPERRQVLLDLGGPTESLINHLGSTRPCRIEIADLAARGGIQMLNGLADFEGVDEAALIRGLLPVANAEKLDTIFCWDLPNYLSLDALQHLIDVISARAAPGCRLHMLIAYSKREMPATPARYLTDSEGKLVQRCSNGATRAAPRYSPEDLGIAVGRFRYERGVLLANGMQEFAYTWPA